MATLDPSNRLDELLDGGTPVFTMLIAAPLLGERLSGARLIGLALSLLGVSMVVLRGAHEGMMGLSALGDGLVLLSALGLAAYLVLGRRAFPGESSLELVGGVTVFGLLFLLPVSGAELATQGMSRPTHGDLLGILYLGTAASGLAFMLWAYGLRHLEAGQAAIFMNLNLLVGVIAAAVALNKSVSWLQLAGGMLILGGAWLVTRPVPEIVTLTEAISAPDGPEVGLMSA